MPCPSSLLRSVFENLFRQMVFYVGLITHRFDVGGSQQLGAVVAQLLADVLLYAGVIQLTLAGWFLFDELVDRIAERSSCARRQQRDDVRYLPWLQPGDRGEDRRGLTAQARLRDKAHVSAVAGVVGVLRQLGRQGSKVFAAFQAVVDQINFSASLDIVSGFAVL